MSYKIEKNKINSLNTSLREKKPENILTFMLLDTYNFKLVDPMLEYMHIYLWDIVNIII